MNFLRKIINNFNENKINDFLCLEQHIEKFRYINHLEGVHTLVFGSSHLEVGYYPQDGEFNFAITSQDLYYSYNMYKITNNPNVKNIILSFSDFSSWHDLSSSPYSDYTLYYQAFCNILPVKKQIDMKKLRKLKKIAKIELSKGINSQYNGEYLYYSNKQYKENKNTVLEWALKYNNRFYKNKHDALKYLLLFLDDTQKNNQNLIIVITPISSLLFKNISIPEEDLFKELYIISEPYKHAKILNYRNSSEFTQDDFADWEHLNNLGAKKLTEKIRTVIKD